MKHVYCTLLDVIGVVVIWDRQCVVSEDYFRIGTFTRNILRQKNLFELIAFVYAVLACLASSGLVETIGAQGSSPSW